MPEGATPSQFCQDGLMLAQHVALSFLCGDFVGSGLDGLHNYSGNTVYTRGWVGKMAWWTPLLFGGAGVIALGAYPLIEHRLKTKLAAPAERTQLYIGLVSFMA